MGTVGRYNLATLQALKLKPMKYQKSNNHAGFQPVMVDGTGSNGKPILPTVRRFQGGFTLLEIMIVTVIVGIAVSLAVASLRVDTRETLTQESMRVLSLLEGARDEAVFGGRAVAVRLRAGQLEMLKRDPHRVNAPWQALTDGRAAPRPLPTEVTAALRVGGLSAADRDQEPIVFLPAGITAPFELTLLLAEHRHLIRGDALGNITLKGFDVASR